MIKRFLFGMREFFRNKLWYYRLVRFLNKGNSMNRRSTYNNLKKYYESCDLFLPESSSWRHFRFFLIGGRVVKIKERVNSKEKLRRLLLKYVPLDVYYSQSLWVNPVNVGVVSKIPLYNNLFIKNEVHFDVDDSNLNRARLKTLDLVFVLKDLGFKIKSIRFSGSKGFHVVIYYDDDLCISDPFLREREVQLRRKRLLNKVKKRGGELNKKICVDENITLNTRGIIRLPGTVNSKSGFVCSVIGENDLKKPVKELLSGIHKVPVRPVGGELGVLKKIRVYLDRSSSSNLSYNSMFLSNLVNGTRRNFVLFLHYKRMPLDFLVSELERLQDLYSLRQLFVFKYRLKDEYFVICPQLFDEVRLKKILRSSVACNKKSSLCSPFYYFDFSKAVFLRVLNKDVGRDFFVSKSHMFVLKKLSGKELFFCGLAGFKKPLVYEVSVVKGKIKKKNLLSDDLF